MSPHAVEAVLFDFHGTLVHGGGFSFEVAMRTLLDSLGASGIAVDESEFKGSYRAELRRYFERHASLGLEQHNSVWLARALSRLGHESRPGDEPIRRAVDAYFDRFTAELTCFPGVDELLASLHGRFRIGLLSNFTDPRPVRRVLEREGLAPYFHSVLISAEVGRRKPLPWVFETALRDLGARAGSTLFVGDDPDDDILGAKAVGMLTAWVRPSSQAPLLRWMDEEAPGQAEGADITVTSVVELRELLAA